MKNISIKKYQDSSTQKGQALITLLVFVVVATVIISGAVAVTIINSQSTGKLAESEFSIKVAEAGIETALIKLIRNPNYVGETITISDGTATINITGTGTKTIISEGSAGDFKKKVQVTGSFVNNVFNLTSWQEID